MGPLPQAKRFEPFGDCRADLLVRASATDALRQLNQLDLAACKPAKGPAAAKIGRPPICFGYISSFPLYSMSRTRNSASW
jgi:hypothetical protein